MELERSPTEIQIQREIWGAIWKLDANSKQMLFHVPNESTYNNSQQKSSGVIPGVPDMLFINRARTWYIELKDDSGRIDIDQKIWHAQADKNGVKVFVFYSAAPAISFVTSIINGMTYKDAVDIFFTEYISPFSNGELYESLLLEKQTKKKASLERKAAKGFKFKLGVKKN